MPQRKGHNGPTPRSIHDLGIMDLAEAAVESEAAMRALAHAFRRFNDAHSHMTRAYARITQGWAREHGEPDPTPLAEVIQFPGPANGTPRVAA